jgi:hypothetical protein
MALVDPAGPGDHGDAKFVSQYFFGLVARPGIHNHDVGEAVLDTRQTVSYPGFFVLDDHAKADIHSPPLSALSNAQRS